MENSFNFIILFLLCVPVATVSSYQTVFNVVEYGAVGDGRADDTNVSKLYKLLVRFLK